jgi:hypothetical protein
MAIKDLDYFKESYYKKSLNKAKFQQRLFTFDYLQVLILNVFE